MFDWGTAKAEENLSNHGVSFSEAEQAFEDFYAIEEYDAGHSEANESRFQMIAWAGRRVLFVVYTVRGEKYRIISAREAKNHERKLYERQRSEDAFYQ